MFKIIGSLMTGGVCFYVGFKRSMQLKIRYRSLCDFKNALELLSTEIAFRETELRQAFINTGNVLLKEAARYIEKDGVKSALVSAVKKCSVRLCLTEGDKDTILMLKEHIGMTDVEHQIKNIESVKNILDLHIKAAKYDMDKLCRLYSGGGILTGIFLILVFI